MRSTRTIVFGCALIAVALIFWVIVSKIRQSNAPVIATSPTTAPGLTPVSATTSGRIAVAATDIPAGSIVTADMMEMKDYSGPSTQGFITDIDKQASGFITRVAIPKGGQVRPDEDFIGHISQVGIAGALRPGTRALVLPLPGKPTLHDLVKIGNSIDVLASFDGQESRTIVEDVRVMAVDVFANDYPPVKAAMRGAYKAAPAGERIGTATVAPGAPSAAASAAPDSAPPAAAPTPTPAPQNLPPLDPALTLEVTPQQAATIQLALASGAPLDFLVRPALPANRSGEATLISDGDTDGAVAPIANGVTKSQIAPYAESVKRGAGKAGNAAANRGNGSANNARQTGSSANRPARNTFPVPDFPPVTTTKSPGENLPAPFPVSQAPSGGNGEFGAGNGNARPSEPAVPRAPSTYQIPIYSNGGVVRTETVPVPIR